MTGMESSDADCCGARALFGWSPPPLPADTPLKRWIDRAMPRTGFPCLLYYLGVVALLNVGPHLPQSWALAVDGLAALAAGAWCGANFWRCRHAHCAVSGAGWLALALFCVVEAALGRSLIHGDEEMVFLAVLVVALAFEGLWYWARGTNTLGSTPARR